MFKRWKVNFRVPFSFKAQYGQTKFFMVEFNNAKYNFFLNLFYDSLQWSMVKQENLYWSSPTNLPLLQIRLHWLSAWKEMVMTYLSTGLQTALTMRGRVGSLHLWKEPTFMNRAVLIHASFDFKPRASANLAWWIERLAFPVKRYIIQVSNYAVDFVFLVSFFSRGYAERRNDYCCRSEYANFSLTQM